MAVRQAKGSPNELRQVEHDEMQSAAPEEDGTSVWTNFSHAVHLALSDFKTLFSEKSEKVTPSNGGKDLQVVRYSQELKKSYEQHFSPPQYFDTYYRHLDEEVKFFLKGYMNALGNDSRSSLVRRTQPITVLDVGCGPVPVYVAALIASAPSNTNIEITMADMLPQNRRSIILWQQNHPAALDWREYFQYISSKAGVGQAALLDRVRRSIKTVQHCDVLSRGVVNSGSSRYTIIMTTLCLEFATTTAESYCLTLRKLANLLEEKGELLLAGALGNTRYKLGEHEYPSLHLSEELVKAGIRSAGLKLRGFKSLLRCTDPATKPADHCAVFYASATKD